MKTSKRILICGGRDYFNYRKFDRHMDEIYGDIGEGEDFDCVVIQGGKSYVLGSDGLYDNIGSMVSKFVHCKEPSDEKP